MRWLAGLVAAALAAAALWAVLSARPAETEHPEIDAASRAELDRVLREADEREAAR